MLLFSALLAFSCVGFSTGFEKEMHCYGTKLSLPFSYNPQRYKGPIYFTPRGAPGSSRRLIMNNGQSNHPRLKVALYAVTLTDLRETDDGIYSVSFGGDFLTNIIDLKILDCADDITLTYWHALSLDVPRDAQYLEFISLKGGQAEVLWNRTGSQVKTDKVQMKRNVINIFFLTQADNGYYNLRKKDHTLLKRKKLQVKENKVSRQVKENDFIFFTFPFTSSPLTVTYIQDGDDKEYTLIENGITMEQNIINSPLKGSFYMVDQRIEISPGDTTDTGYFYVKDQNGNLAQTVRLEVLDAYLPTYVYILVPVLIILVLIGCCCCVKKCCCEKSSPKTNKSAPVAQYQDRTQPSVSYFAAPAPTLISYRPATPVAPTGPAAPSSTGPSAAAPSHPTASAAGFKAQPSFLSTDVEPSFELKGSNFLSEPLFSADSSSPCVYTSDKLNFL